MIIEILFWNLSNNNTLKKGLHDFNDFADNSSNIQHPFSATNVQHDFLFRSPFKAKQLYVNPL